MKNTIKKFINMLDKARVRYTKRKQGEEITVTIEPLSGAANSGIEGRSSVFTFCARTEVLLSVGAW